MRAADKVIAREDLAARLPAARKTHGKVVFTCGVFDLLHIGHVRYLEYARSLGGLLVVGVNSDESVRQLGKSPDRPIVGQAERAELVAALESVAYVCIFDEMRPIETIRILRPDIHVKDAAYQSGVLPEAAMVEQVGGVIAFAPHVEGWSTTGLAARLFPGGESR